MFKQNVMAAIIGAVLVIGAISAMQLNLAVAAPNKNQPIKVLSCDTAKTCKAVFVRPTGDIQFIITNTANSSGGGGGTVDQTARDLITAMQNGQNAQDNEIKNLKGNNSALLDQLNGVKQIAIDQNMTINSLKTQVANLTEQIKNAIIDVNVENQTTTGGGGGNQSGGGTGGNQSGGTGDNNTGGGSNNTGGSTNGTIPTSLNLQKAFDNYVIRTSG